MVRLILRARRQLAAAYHSMRAAWADTLHDKADQLRDAAQLEHRIHIPLLMARCTHALRIRHPYNPSTVRDFCPRCAGRQALPPTASARVSLLLALADMYDQLGGVRRR